MKLVRWGPRGAERPGLIDEGGTLRDLSAVLAPLGGDLGGAALADMGWAEGLDVAALPAVEGAPRLGVPVAGVGKVLCIGLNYSDHAREAGMELPAEPILFMKATSALAGPNDPLELPRGAERVDWEVELAVIIGRPARYVGREEAMAHVAGYAVFNDISERDFQLNRGGQWTKGKSCDGFGPLGPWLVTPDEVADPQALGLELRVNGEVMQSGTTANMIFGVAELVSYLSQFMTLEPGDVIATGTPPGVGMGMRPERYLAPGDVVEARIDGLGAQRFEVRPPA